MDTIEQRMNPDYPAGFPVEYLPRKGQKDSWPIVEVFGAGTVKFSPRKQYDGRCICWLPTREAVKHLLGLNPPGQPIFVEPTDIIDAATVQAIRTAITPRFAKINQRLKAIEKRLEALDGIKPPKHTKKDEGDADEDEEA